MGISSKELRCIVDELKRNAIPPAVCIKCSETYYLSGDGPWFCDIGNCDGEIIGEVIKLWDYT